MVDFSLLMKDCLNLLDVCELRKSKKATKSLFRVMQYIVHTIEEPSISESFRIFGMSQVKSVYTKLFKEELKEKS